MVTRMASSSTKPAILARRDAVKALLAERDGALVVSGLGSPTYDVHAAGDPDDNYYLWGAMGAAALIGLGLAQAQPKQRVLVVTGDGEQLMALGGLATIAVAKPRNLVIVVIDNGRFGETGMQISHTGLGIDLAKIAAACGFQRAATLTRIDEVEKLAREMREPADGPSLFVIKVAAENAPRSLPPRDAVYIKNRFRAALGLSPV
jgi:thiamine pyrophosphate-dependent acetolactate synthase large subunit-like protein